jgi:cysteine desulfurase / selenocysteine lyase
VKWLLEKGIDTLHSREMMLWDQLRKGIQHIDHVITYCAESTENHSHVLSFNIRNFEAADVGTLLDVDYNIASRTGLQCAPKVHVALGTDTIHGTVRLSLGPFNTEEHIAQAVHAVSEIAAIRR